MKSSRYEILPRVRKVIPYMEGMEHARYRCMWKDPGDLPQRRGEPLNYERIFLGYGYTIDEAIKSCRMEYLDWCCCNAIIKDGRVVERRSATERYLYGDGRYVKPVKRYELPERLLATSNLPWWKRLFRL